MALALEDRRCRLGERRRARARHRQLPDDDVTLENLRNLPMSAAFEHPALPPVKTETYIYVEHHFSCGNCGLHTPGHIDPAIGSGGNGWKTKREARASLTAHLRKCRGAR